MGNSLIKLSRRKRNNESDTNQNRNQTQRNDENINEMIVVGPSNENQHLLPSSIFKLNGHCFDELFDYLSLKDLHSLGQTCKLMQQMTGNFFKLNYSAAKFNCFSNGIYMIDFRGTEKYIPIPGFIQFVTWIALDNSTVACEQRKRTKSGFAIDIISHSEKVNLDKFKYIKLHANELKKVKKLTLSYVCLKHKTMNYILSILPNIEVLELNHCLVNQDLYDVLLKYCKNVQRIQLFHVQFKNNFKWLLQQYEKLEHLDLGVNDPPDRINELSKFFERNSSIRSFSCDLLTLWSNKDAFLNSTVRMDTFELKYKDKYDNSKSKNSFVGKSLWDLLHQLHSHGFYKRLHINVDSNKRFDELPEIPFLEKLCVACYESSLEPLSNNLIEFAETGEIYVSNENIISGQFKNEILVKNLMNVEHLYLYKNRFHSFEYSPDTLLFIQQLKNLKKIKFNYFESGEILDLVLLNTEREKLTGARKVTIYVSDSVYLATKWAIKNGITNFNFIEMKRNDSYEWNRSTYDKHWSRSRLPHLPQGMGFSEFFQE